MFKIRFEDKPYMVLSVKIVEGKTKFLIFKETEFIWIDSSEAILFETKYII